MTEKKLTINELRAGTKSSWALRIGGAAVLIAAVAAGVWYFGLADTAKVPVYRTVEITRGPLEVTVVANGTVNPVRTVSIGSELSGIVRKVNVDVNSIVKAGDVLIELDKGFACQRQGFFSRSPGYACGSRSQDAPLRRAQQELGRKAALAYGIGCSARHRFKG